MTEMSANEKLINLLKASPAGSGKISPFLWTEQDCVIFFPPIGIDFPFVSYAACTEILRFAQNDTSGGKRTPRLFSFFGPILRASPSSIPVGQIKGRPFLILVAP